MIGFAMALLLLSFVWPDLLNYVIAAVFLFASYSALLAYGKLNRLGYAKEKAREMLDIFSEGGPEALRTSLDEIEYCFRSPELCKAAVSRNSYNFKYVPDEYKTSEIAMIALKSNGKNLQYFDESQITLDYVIAAVSQEIWLSPSKNSSSFSQSVQRVKPIGSLGDEYDDESPFKFIPGKYRNEKIARLAISFTPRALRFFPADTVSDIAYVNAMAHDGSLLLDVPLERRTMEICWAALNSKEGASKIGLDDIPKHSRTVEIYKLFVDRDPQEFANVPDNIKTNEMCLIAVSRSGAELSNVPLEQRSYAICHAAVEQYGDALEWVPMHCRDLAMYEAAIRNRATLSLVPEELRSKDICDLAVAAASHNIRYVPIPLQTRDMQFRAIDGYPGSIHDIPESLVDEELYIRALKRELSEGGGTIKLNTIPERIAHNQKVSALVDRVNTMYEDYNENMHREEEEERSKNAIEKEKNARAIKAQEDAWIEQNKINISLNEEREKENQKVKAKEEQRRRTIGYVTKVYARIHVFNIDGMLMFDLEVGQDAVIVGYTSESVTYHSGLHLITYDNFKKVTARQYRGELQ